VSEDLPETENLSEETLQSEDLLKKLHKVLLEIEIVEGELICPETGRKFPITNGI
jgi:multifunctional methyltransferase subunit TRM112